MLVITQFNIKPLNAIRKWYNIIENKLVIVIWINSKRAMIQLKNKIMKKK